MRRQADTVAAASPVGAAVGHAPSRAEARALPAGLDWLIWLAVGAGALSLLVLAVQSPAVIHNVYTNADNATAPVLAALAGAARAGRIVNLGNHPWYEPWWFMRATVGLPWQRELWEAAPPLFGFAGIAVVVACARRALGWTAAALSAVVLVSAGDSMRALLFAPESRVAMVSHLGVLCAALLFVRGRASAGRISPAMVLALGVPLVLFTGAGATDQLVIVSAVAPYMLAGLLCWWREHTQAARTVAIFAVVSGALSLALAALLDRAMAGEGVIPAPLAIHLVAGEDIAANLQNLPVSFSSLADGSFFGLPLSASALPTLALGVLSLGALAGVLRGSWRWLRRDRGAARAASRPQALRDLYIAFWGCSLPLVLGAFASTSFGADPSNNRYLLGAAVAVPALLGAFATTARARAAITIGVFAFALLTVRAHIVNGVPPGAGPSPQTAAAIERFTLAHGAHVGYGPYWDSSPVTWETGGRVRTYPIQRCDGPAGLCPYSIAQVSTWYTARAGVRSFLLTDSSATGLGGPIAPPPQFGRPIAQSRFGSRRVFIYDHDLASDLRRPARAAGAT